MDNGLAQLEQAEQTFLQWITSDDLVAVAVVSAFWIAVIFVIALIVDRAAVKLLKKLLYRDAIPLAGAKIVINVTRFFIWFSAVGVTLDLVFGLDVAAIITAMGIGGIAISLGCQDTLSNLIGGFQVSLGGVIDIGDRVEISGREGVVEDCNWRHMVIRDYSDNSIKIPNSMINNSVLIVRPDHVYADVPILVRYEHVTDGRTLDDRISEIEGELREAVSEVAEVIEGPTFRFSNMTDFGYQGTVTFKVKPDVKASLVKDVVIRRIADLGQR